MRRSLMIATSVSTDLRRPSISPWFGTFIDPPLATLWGGCTVRSWLLEPMKTSTTRVLSGNEDTTASGVTTEPDDPTTAGSAVGIQPLDAQRFSFPKAFRHGCYSFGKSVETRNWH
ncbi:hypothetical protein XCCB100_3330 [Xanthomonas campestris pv. campestris]|uniref:Uncharacterized protein n=1 Tax=Xanthomonas campestris pv. campestris (strain B100) TaxID=509169 RepID=B0RYH5_XANCB|nr:hypothetical protein XCCB100_3330 [Xanthomonas campestris pv. campestris]